MIVEDQYGGHMHTVRTFHVFDGAVTKGFAKGKSCNALGFSVLQFMK